MSTETIRRCDQCRAIMPPTVRHFMMEVLIMPMVNVQTDGAPIKAIGEFCGHDCVQRRIASTLSLGTEVAA